MDGIIFDIDGTLWDSTDPVAASWNRAIQENSSLDLTVDAKILSGLFGKTMTEIGNELFPALPVKEREHLLNICLEQENNYLEQHPGIFYDGVIETIKKLSEKHPLYRQQLSARIYRSNHQKRRDRVLHQGSSVFWRDTGIQRSDSAHADGEKRAQRAGICRRYSG